MSGQFEMTIDDVFLIGKHTVFVGKICGGSDRIKKCECELMIDNEVVDRITIEDEDLFSRDARSLRTLERVEFDRSQLEAHECKLVCR